MQTNHIPSALKALRRELDHYRQIGKRAVFPELVKQKVIAVSDEYTGTTITQTLGISPTSLQRWKRQLAHLSGEPLDDGEPSMFVSLPKTTSTTSTTQEQRFAFSITLCCDSPSREVNIRGSVTLTQWAELLNTISQEMLS